MSKSYEIISEADSILIGEDCPETYPGKDGTVFTLVLPLPLVLGSVYQIPGTDYCFYAVINREPELIPKIGDKNIAYRNFFCVYTNEKSMYIPSHFLLQGCPISPR